MTTYAGTLTFGRKKPLIVNPGALCADSRYLYVCDVGSHRILRIDFFLACKKWGGMVIILIVARMPIKTLPQKYYRSLWQKMHLL